MGSPKREGDNSPMESSMKDMHLKEEGSDTQPSIDHLHILSPQTDSSTSHTAPSSPKIKTKSSSSSPSSIKAEEAMASPASEVVGGEVSLKLEPGKAPKLSRSASQKIKVRPPQLFDHLEDSTDAATSSFQVISDCIYGSKHMGSSEHDVLDCDCSESWDGKINLACDEDSDCINRATKMECVDNECNCGPRCQNQRFQRKQWASVSVIKTEKKGYGLRCDKDLQPNDFIFEYIGEVINENHFRKRMIQYDEEGIKHFYFMSLSKNEFVDATKKGNLGRFCNHSCNPNCYVDKWVVGDKFRMGIFAERKIKAGEELVFNYNVDRYGANPQPCYCGELNCTGFIGGKTQTERATKLSTQTLEALGIDDGDGWDTAVSKRPRKKKVGEDDEEYVNNVQPKALSETDVTKVIASLMQTKEKWIAVKILSRIQQCDSNSVRSRVVRMHGYVALKTVITNFADDANVVLQVLQVLDSMPRLTRNKIQDAKIEAVVQTLCDDEDERVPPLAKRLLSEWSKLEMGYRIPRRKEQEAPRNTFERRESHETTRKPRERSRSPQPPKGPSSSSAPMGPKYSSNSYTPVRPGLNPRNNVPPLPRGWFAAPSGDGRTYYYSATCPEGTWTRPDKPAVPPPPPPVQISQEQKLNDMVQKILQEGEANKAKQQALEKAAAAERLAAAAAAAASREPSKPKEKWRSLPIEKQKRIYENTVFPSIIYVLDKYKRKLPRDDLKRFGKEVSKLISASDYKHNRVDNPTKLTPKQEKQIKNYTKQFLDKAVAKKKIRDKERAEKKAEKEKRAKAGDKTAAAELKAEEAESAEAKSAEQADEMEAFDAKQDFAMSDVEDDVEDQKQSIKIHLSTDQSPSSSMKRKRQDDEPSTASTPTKRVRSTTPPLSGELSPSGGMKRKRDDLDAIPQNLEGAPLKRLKSESPPDSPLVAPPPPPPPPPPTNGEEMIDPGIGLQDQVDTLRKQGLSLDEVADTPMNGVQPTPLLAEQSQSS